MKNPKTLKPSLTRQPLRNSPNRSASPFGKSSAGRAVSSPSSGNRCAGFPDDFGRRFGRRAKRLYALAACFLLAVTALAVPALAADDPLAVVQKLSDFIFSLIRAVGLILLGYGILQVGLSFQSHDPSQRSNGILTIAGGIVITFTKGILTLITG